MHTLLPRLFLRSTQMLVAASFATILLLPGMARGAEAPTTEEAAIAEGGRLYDKWYKVIDAEEPKTAHPLYPKDKKYADKPGANWRCKECHGWDYQGKDGAYASGKHHSGIVGIAGAKGADPKTIVAALKDPAHGYAGKLSDDELQRLALFVSKGQVDMDQYIDRASKKPKGDATKGAVLYETLCSGCHGYKGTEPEDMKPLGALMSNPWEILHKILNGQPAEAMPAMRAVDRQIAVDIMAHLATLPKER